MPEIEIAFAFDYVDPGSYLAVRLLDRWSQRVGIFVQVKWIPLELRPPSTTAIDPRAREWSEMVRGMEAHAKRLDIPFREPTHVPKTRKAHEMAIHARHRGCFPSVHQALFDAYFQDGRDIGRIDVLESIGAAQGIEGAEIRTVLGVDRYAAEVDDARSRALGEGIRGVPLLIAHGRRLEGLGDPAEIEAFLGSILDRGGPRGPPAIET